jgi:hypothetical protein
VVEAEPEEFRPDFQLTDLETLILQSFRSILECSELASHLLGNVRLLLQDARWTGGVDLCKAQEDPALEPTSILIDGHLTMA